MIPVIYRADPLEFVVIPAVLGADPLNHDSSCFFGADPWEFIGISVVSRADPWEFIVIPASYLQGRSLGIYHDSNYFPSRSLGTF